MVNSKNKQPLYNQLVDALKIKIENEMNVNDRLPSERELSIQYGLSRTTVRIALNELELMGYVHRQHGKGTFVSNVIKGQTDLSGTYSFTEQMKSLGKDPETQILSFKTMKANQFIAEGLGIEQDTEIIKIKRLRLADKEPMMLERTYLPLSKFPDLNLESLQSAPLYDLFIKKYNQTVKVADEILSVGIMTAKDAQQLKFYEGAPVLKLKRTTYNNKNEIIEYTLSVARGDKFTYHIRHQR
ncbi:MAG: GntR family transcriptional regulator [Latilactobacillus curvatus]|uniref:GntR family transcriptional regulator n=1 Tax=Latilactobacillus curvatus TaxID=28038 RepID=UPI001CBFC3E1|nr:GntR family transcriptional regulator [Latilactobacillus curvatus]MBZ1504875.1 GntR family transcriptional regulator [Latilactobacillus curvatus]MDG2981602.1 GntR family transcriptional regulator [Latilactobacillus curvatus]